MLRLLGKGADLQPGFPMLNGVERPEFALGASTIDMPRQSQDQPGFRRQSKV